MTDPIIGQEDDHDASNEHPYRELEAHAELIRRMVVFTRPPPPTRPNSTNSNSQESSNSNSNEEDEEEDDDNDDMSTTSITMNMECVDVDDVFRVRSISISVSDDETMELCVYYTILAIEPNGSVMKTTFLVPNGVDMVDSIFDVFWMYKPCPECLRLIRKKADVCRKCTFHKMRQQFGLKKGYITDLNTCPVCQDHVYHTRLQCGHHIHHSCLVHLYAYRQSIQQSIDMKCPVCRRAISVVDKNRFFGT